MKKILITAGSTKVMIDQVRCISNIFKGSTGSEIAREAFYNGYDVTLVTSNPKYFGSEYFSSDDISGINVVPYNTYDDLLNTSEQLIKDNNFDIIVWSAAISDFRVDGTYWIENEIYSGTINGDSGSRQILYGKIDSSAKIASNHDSLYLKLVPTEKIIDKIREPWGFKGKLVKFKLQVNISDDKLIDIAKKSCSASKADLIVANCLEWSKERAYIISNSSVINVTRQELPNKLLSCLD